MNVEEIIDLLSTEVVPPGTVLVDDRSLIRFTVLDDYTLQLDCNGHSEIWERLTLPDPAPLF